MAYFCTCQQSTTPSWRTSVPTITDNTVVAYFCTCQQSTTPLWHTSAPVNNQQHRCGVLLHLSTINNTVVAYFCTYNNRQHRRGVLLHLSTINNTVVAYFCTCQQSTTPSWRTSAPVNNQQYRCGVLLHLSTINNTVVAYFCTCQQSTTPSWLTSVPTITDNTIVAYFCTCQQSTILSWRTSVPVNNTYKHLHSVTHVGHWRQPFVASTVLPQVSWSTIADLRSSTSRPMLSFKQSKYVAAGLRLLAIPCASCHKITCT